MKLESMKILGIVGSYRKNGIIDSLATEVLSSAEKCGATTKKLDDSSSNRVGNDGMMATFPELCCHSLNSAAAVPA